MDKDRKDKITSSGEEKSPEENRGVFEGKYRTTRPDETSLPEEDTFLKEEEDELLLTEKPEDEEEESDVVIPTPLDKKPVRKKKRRKKALPLLITALIFIALFAGYAAMVWLIPEKTVENNDPIKEYEQLVDYPTAQISAINFKYQDGYEYKLCLTRYVNESGYTVTEYSVANKGEFDYDQVKYGNMVAQIATITSGTVANIDADLSTYGLDDPKVTVTYYILDENGRTSEGATLFIGNPAPVGNGHYAMRDGDNAVYVLGYADADYIVAKDYEYRILTLFQIADYINEVQSVSFKQGDDELFVARATKEEKDQLEYATTYRIYEPALLNCNTYFLEEKVLSKMTNFTALSVVEDYPSDLGIYGLAAENNPKEITIETIDGTVTRFTVASDLNEDGTVYGKISGMTSVFTFDPAIFDFSDVTYDELYDMTIWTYLIENVDHVDFDFNGKHHTLKVSENSEGKFVGKLDAIDIDESDTGLLYARLLQIYLDDILVDGESGSKITYSFKIYGKDGDIRKLELAEINERRFQVILDDVPQDYFVRYNALKHLENGIQDLYEGLHLSYAF